VKDQLSSCDSYVDGDDVCHGGKGGETSPDLGREVRVADLVDLRIGNLLKADTWNKSKSLGNVHDRYP
jgi:hypothetical protein